MTEFAIPLSALVGGPGSPSKVSLGAYLLMFSAAVLLTIVGALKTFAPGQLLRFSRWRRRRSGVSPAILENVEKTSAWKWNQRIPGLLALGFGLFLLFVLVRSLLHGIFLALFLFGQVWP